ncbi:MAG TPA: hypothetical protein VN030_14005 [Cellvibrio sp.]|nr:hypothetical protein [Cellvibrio sp.]
MTTQKLKQVTSIFIIALSSCASATPSSQNQECTTGISNLLTLVARTEFFDESRETFVSKSANFLHIEKYDSYAPDATRVILKKESWLNSGDLIYISEHGLPAKFVRAEFSINRSCSPKYKDFLTLATKNLKGEYTLRPSPEDESAITRVWTLPDPDYNMQRNIEVSESNSSLDITVIRAPFTEEGGE